MVDMITRLRRNRHTPWMRDLVRENRVHPHDFIYPLFVQPGKNKETAIKTLPGVSRVSVDKLVKRVKEASSLGIPAVMLFPVVDAKHKTDDGKEALNPDSLICNAVKAVKDAVPDIGVICDVALDPYTTHGQDGLVKNGKVLNDATVDVLIDQALTLARAGADVVAPSDMMDGRVIAIRRALDHGGHHMVPIFSYAAKYASHFYGPFRDAVGSQKALKGDKRSYQMDPANSREAFREVGADVSEGADMVIIKPGMPYLDIIAMIASNTYVPVCGYQVSGEYAMIHAGAKAGAFDFSAAMEEALTAFKRAGASTIISYGAMDILKRL